MLSEKYFIKLFFEGFCPEGIGIIPDILVENSKADINGGRDNVMDHAIRFLSD